ncbi:unannotated protein [freshwater metagenome]|uniref:Unannotated protein n=1 Tax=freshwater metagenome TaxID=449393 RepID=A0A6J7CUH7_9ZZZZ
MGMAAATFGAVCLWLVLWSLNVKGFDAFMLVVLIVLISATLKAILPNLPGNQTPPGD